MMAALYFHPEGYTTRGPKLMGRHAAGESFLRAYLGLAKERQQDLWAVVDRPEFGNVFAKTARSAGCQGKVHGVLPESLRHLRTPGNVYYPGPGIGSHAWQRTAFGNDAWSLCGVTHTTASAGAMDTIAELLTAPVQPWDAVICTSNAVKDNVRRVLGAQLDYLQDRLGVQRSVLPLLPVIPLGIHCADFAYTENDRAEARNVLGADGKTHVVMFMGRLVFHAKAHPLAMYQALERAAATLPEDEKVVLVECGWHPNEPVVKAYRDAAALACPRVRVVTLDGRDPGQRKTAWAGADVFCSLADNIQETFGIVPIEAMAAGLPVVVSDWDGYRDTVRDGIDGFRIPTLMPGPGLGSDLAHRHALGIDPYDMYCGYTSSLVAVDVEAAATAFSRLFSSPSLRREMAEAGRKRAREVYDWQVVIRQYEALWARQSTIRREQGGRAKGLAHPWPARLDPFYGFAAYPTRRLDADTRLALVDEDPAVALGRAKQYRELAMVNYAGYLLPSDRDIAAVIAAVGPGGVPAATLVARMEVTNHALQIRSLAWFVKMGLLRVVE